VAVLFHQYTFAPLLSRYCHHVPILLFLMAVEYFQACVISGFRRAVNEI
jgi:hypothetical protein